jgi:hypothetical protein
VPESREWLRGIVTGRGDPPWPAFEDERGVSDYLELRNWGLLQHYTDRNPPWVKLYPEIIDARENPDLCALSLGARFLAFGMICLAAKTDNMIPSSPGWIAAEVKMTSRAVTKALSDLRSIDFFIASDGNGDGKLAINGTREVDRPREQRTEAVEAKASPARPRDEIWDTLEVLFGTAPKGSNAHSRRNKAVADLKRFGATAESVVIARKRWERVFEGATATDIGIATHYGRLTVGVNLQPAVPCPVCEMGGGRHAADCEAVA